jgi:iron complex outermembrane receptor protein
MHAGVVSFTSLLLLIVFATSAAAQTASLVARVIDPDRAVVEGAAVILSDARSGAQYTVLTSNEGTARFTGLVPGEYRLEVAARNFKVHAQTITLGAGERTVEARLEIAPLQEDVTVQGVATVPTIGRVNMPLRDQPLTVNTLTSEFLANYAVNDVVTALKYVPNVTAYSQYGVYQYFTFRGFSDSLQLVDGIRNEGNRVNTQLANVERLEVLKGPASVLYGGDAVGATVNLVLKKPSPDPAYDFSATAGLWETYRGAFGAAGRVGSMEQVFYRFDIAGDSTDNFRHDPSNRFNVTPSVTWRLPRTAQLDFRYSYDRNRASGDSGIPLVPLTAGFTPDPERTAVGDPLARAVQGDGSDFIPNVPRDSRYNTPQDFSVGTDHNTRVSYAQAFGGNLAFRNTFGYRYFDDEYWIAEFLDVTPPSRVNRGFLYFKHHRRPWTNQAELSGQIRSGITQDFLLGYDFQDYGNYTHRRAAANFNTTPIDLYDPVETHVTVDLDSFPVTRSDHFQMKTNGIFFQDTLTVMPQVKAVAGGRYDWVRRRSHNNPVVDGVETEGPITLGESEKFTYRLGVVYQPATRLDLYAQSSTAFRPNFSTQSDGTPLEPEYGVQYEVGQRLRLMEERLQLSAAIFNIEKRNVARSLGGGLFEQIGKLRSRGFETEVAGNVTSRWVVSAGYGFTDATFLDYYSGNINLTGNTPRRVPEHTVTFSTSYAWANGFSVSAGIQAVSDQFINDTNTIKFNGYDIVNLGASYTKGRVQYQLNLTNLTDTEYWASSLGNRQLYPGQPFNVMGTVRIRTN